MPRIDPLPRNYPSAQRVRYKETAGARKDTIMQSTLRGSCESAATRVERLPRHEIGSQPALRCNSHALGLSALSSSGT